VECYCKRALGDIECYCKRALGDVECHCKRALRDTECYCALGGRGVDAVSLASPLLFVSGNQPYPLAAVELLVAPTSGIAAEAYQYESLTTPSQSESLPPATCFTATEMDGSIADA
jgi:hypothetical protein